jgi:hypothetical protein
MHRYGTCYSTLLSPLPSFVVMCVMLLLHKYSMCNNRYMLCFSGLCVCQYHWKSLRLSGACTLSHTNKIDAIWKHVKLHISAYTWKVHHLLYLTEYMFGVYMSHDVYPFIMFMCIVRCVKWSERPVYLHAGIHPPLTPVKHLQPLAAPTTATFKALCLIAIENFLAVVSLYCSGASYFYQ